MPALHPIFKQLLHNHLIKSTKMGVFFKKTAKIKNNDLTVWLMIFVLSALFAAGDSVLVLYTPLKTAFDAFQIGGDAAKYAALAAVLIYVIMIDYANSVFYPNAIQGILESKTAAEIDHNRRQIAIGTFIYCLVAIFITIGTSYYLRHSSAEMAIEAPQLDDTNALTATLSGQIKDSKKSFDNSIVSLENQRSKAVKNATSNLELQKLADSGNGWAAGELRRKKMSAENQYNGQISDIQSRKLSALELSEKNLNSALYAATLSNSFKIERHKIKVQSLSDFLLLMSICATLIQCYAGYMIARHRMLGGVITSQADNKSKKSVITDTDTVKDTIITDEKAEIIYNDSYIKEFIRGIKWEVSNLKTDNGSRTRVLSRMKHKLHELDLIMKKSKHATDKMREQASNFYDETIEKIFKHT